MQDQGVLRIIELGYGTAAIMRHVRVPSLFYIFRSARSACLANEIVWVLILALDIYLTDARKMTLKRSAKEDPIQLLMSLNFE
jgi:hypothetical protein